ncbi:MAG: hypothetical protein K2G90_10715 [Muribaculaceae bacterium]|nr:hypothetical protein [Muribaculaceae bacterium]
MIYDKIQHGLSQFTNSVASLVKVMLLSKGITPKAAPRKGEAIVIMGNGPSLRKTLDKERDWLLGNEVMAVNFFANTPDFPRLRPRYYVLADGVFFSEMSHPNVRKLWEEIGKVSWRMTIFVPARLTHLAKPLVMNNDNITLSTFNLTPVEGYDGLTRALYNAGLGMPRPRNVMIPAIMSAIREGFTKIYLCGADHTWTQTLSVDDENFVVSVQPHFYEDNDKERDRIREAYKGLKLHDVLGSMTVAFRSYWQIRRYADSIGVEIINATPGSMIDAFPRRDPSVM